jgi:hypothetical protein
MPPTAGTGGRTRPVVLDDDLVLAAALNNLCRAAVLNDLPIKSILTDSTTNTIEVRVATLDILRRWANCLRVAEHIVGNSFTTPLQWQWSARIFYSPLPGENP